jgi:hypothetical protein
MDINHFCRKGILKLISKHFIPFCTCTCNIPEHTKKEKNPAGIQNNPTPTPRIPEPTTNPKWLPKHFTPLQNIVSSVVLPPPCLFLPLTPSLLCVVIIASRKHGRSYRSVSTTIPVITTLNHWHLDMPLTHRLNALKPLASNSLTQLNNDTGWTKKCCSPQLYGNKGKLITGCWLRHDCVQTENP